MTIVFAGKFDKAQSALIASVDDLTARRESTMELCRQFGGDVEATLIEVRKFLVDGEEKVFAIRPLRAAEGAKTEEEAKAMKQAGTRFDTLSTSFRRVKAEREAAEIAALSPEKRAAAEKKVKADKAKANKVKRDAAMTKLLETIATSPKAMAKATAVIVGILRSTEKAPFDISKAIAAWSAAAVVYNPPKK